MDENYNMLRVGKRGNLLIVQNLNVDVFKG